MTEELSRVCDLVTGLCGRVRDDLRKHQTATNLPQGVLLYWFVKAAKTYDAVLLLWREGYWQDAATLARTILEIAFQAKYLGEDPEPRAKLFMVHDERERLKMLKTADEYNDPLATDIADLIQSLKPSARAQEKWRNWWGSGKTIRDVAEAVMPKAVYDAQYSILSVLAHSAPPGSSFYLFGIGDTVKVDWKANPPASERNSMAETFIAFASTYMMDIIDTVGTIYGFDYRADLDAAVEAIKRFRNI